MSERSAVQIDKSKARRLTRKIILMEGNFLRDNDKSDADMVKAIMKAIEEEVKCY